MMRMMLSAARQAILSEGTWLSGLRWFEAHELGWSLAAPVLVLVLFLLPLAASPLDRETLSTELWLCGACHILFACCALICAPRGKLMLWCGLVLLSAVNYSCFASMGFLRLHSLSVVYLVLAGCGLLVAVASCYFTLAQLRRLATATTRDGYRWLVTRAPLPVRIWAWRVLRRSE